MLVHMSALVAEVTLQDVGLFVGDENDEQLFQWLIYVTNVFRLDGGVLLASAGQLWEGSDKALDSGARHLPELTRDEG